MSELTPEERAENLRKYSEGNKIPDLGPGSPMYEMARMFISFVEKKAFLDLVNSKGS